MKRIIFLFACVPALAYAADPSMLCPSGYTAYAAPAITIATTCPTGTTSAGTADSCLESNPSMDCVMYAPVGMSYTDASGTYEYTEPCAME